MGFSGKRTKSPSYHFLLFSLFFQLLLLLQFLLTFDSCFFLGLLLRQALQVESETSDPPGAERAERAAAQAYLVLLLDLSHLLLNLLLFFFLPLFLFHFGLKDSFQPLVSLPATNKSIKFKNEKEESPEFCLS